MRSLITIALGMLLLVSAAAAQGNENTAIVTVTTDTSGMLVTGANIAQLSELDANLMGNTIFADQLVDLSATDSDLVGLGDGKTNAIQIADQMLNDTGNTNIDLQAITLAQSANDLTIGNITQMAVQEADDIGNLNLIDQNTTAIAGVFGTIGSPNLLTESELKQTSVLDALAVGNTNNALQESDQFITDNDLVTSKLYEQAAICANIVGNENNLGIGSTQTAIETADANDLTASWANELICLDEQITGNTNDVVQFGETDFFDNLLTTSTSLQDISEKASEVGNSNLVDQLALLSNSANSAVGGHLVQETDIDTNT